MADQYRVERELGRGGMATVYLAHDLKHKRQVALKVLDPELGAVLGKERFLREVETAAGLQHPHILSVFDSGEAAGRLWYSMPYVDGETLRDRLLREGRFLVSDAVRLGQEIAGALQAAHDCGIVHRDIKPENVLLSHGQALVADFGIARSTRPGERQTLTQTGLSLGTPAYMSPEQALGERDLDGRSDIYALGCLVYEMLAGQPPFAGANAQAVIAKHIAEPVPDLRQMRPEVPPAIAAALRQAMAKQPLERFATAAAFGAALAGARGPVTPLSTLKIEKAASRRPSLPLISTAALALLAVAGAGFWLRHDTASPPNGSPRVAVLPFQNLGDPADAYFADGVTDEIRGKLAAIPGLQVIASTSSNLYQHTTKRPEEIGRELGARYLLLGRVRWAKSTGGPNRVRVDPELVEVSDVGAPTTKWQQPFDAPLTDVFEVQADIATKVARELQVTLTPSTQQVLTRLPTRSLDAYDAYLRGIELERVGDAASGEGALVAFEEAVRRDSTFALAWAALAGAHGRKYTDGLRDPAEAEAMRQATERALALAPDLPEAHARKGEYETFVRHDNAKALAAYETGLRLAPSNALLLGRIGFVEMRLGRWDTAVSHLVQATKLDPRSGVRFANLRLAYFCLRRYPEAREAAERAVALAPYRPSPFGWRVQIALSEGDLPAAKALLGTVPPDIDLGAVLANLPTWALDTLQLRLLTKTSRAQFDGNDARRSLVLTETSLRLGDSLKARIYADSARTALARSLARSPDDPELHLYFGLALAYLGRHEDAVRVGEHGVTLLPVNRDAVAGPILQEELARIYLLVGEPEKALDTLEPLLKLPGRLSPGRLRIDTNFALLRGNPRFERLVTAPS